MQIVSGANFLAFDLYRRKQGREMTEIVQFLQLFGIVGGILTYTVITFFVIIVPDSILIRCLGFVMIVIGFTTEIFVLNKYMPR